MTKITRRRFIKYSIGLAAAGAIGYAVANLQAFQKITGHVRVIPTSGAVTVSKGSDLYSMTKMAVDYIGGISRFISSGEKVVIKPNVGCYATPQHDQWQGEIVKGDIIRAVYDLCVDAGASEAVVAECAAGGGQIYWDQLGIADLPCVNMQGENYSDIPTTISGLTGLPVFDRILNTDKVISIAVIKSHSSQAITGTAKNFIGTIPYSRQGDPVNIHVDNRLTVPQTICDLVTAIKPVLCVLDCSVGLDGNAPWIEMNMGAAPHDIANDLGYWMVLVSDDPFRLDAVGAGIIGMEPNKIHYFVEAYNRNLLTTYNPYEIPLEGDETDLSNIYIGLAPPKGDGTWRSPDYYPQDTGL